jgi:hypothetical protein
MINIPVDSYPCSDIDVPIPDEKFGTLIFRTTWTIGQLPTWTLDILDENENNIIVGMNVLPGADNIIKGQASTLDEFRLIVRIPDDLNPTALEIMGRELWPVLLERGDRNPVYRGDPLMENIAPLAPYWARYHDRAAEQVTEDADY